MCVYIIIIINLSSSPKRAPVSVSADCLKTPWPETAR